MITTPQAKTHLRTRAIPEHLKGVFTTRRYTNTPLRYLTLLSMNRLFKVVQVCGHWKRKPAYAISSTVAYRIVVRL